MDLSVPALLLNFGAVAGALVMRIPRHEVSTASAQWGPLVIGLGTIAGFAAIAVFIHQLGLGNGLLQWAISAFLFAFIIPWIFRGFDGLLTIAGLMAIAVGGLLTIPLFF